MSLPALLHFACLALVAALLIGASVQDLRSMTIANGFSIAIAGLFVVSAAAQFMSDRLTLSGVGMTVGCAVIVFAVGVAVFAAGVMGGGDVKLLTALSLFAGPAHIVDLLVVMAVVGGLLGVAILAGAPIGQPATGPQCPRVRRDLPYGPAIAAGGLWILAIQALG